jgi:small conductance mechanosensitive channel
MQSDKGINFDAIMAGMADAISTWGLRVVGALAVLIIGWMAAKVLRRSVRKALERSSLDNTLVPFIASLAYYAMLIFVVVAVLSLFGIQTTSFIAVLGAAGFAIGLALQGTLSNFAAGVMLLVFRPFKVGDYIEAGGAAGSVQEIAVFATTLHSPDNVRIVVPNSSIYGQMVKNYSTNETRRNDMVIGIDYSDDIGKAVETIRKLLAADSRVLKDPAPVIVVGELGDSSVNLFVRPWCTKGDYWGLRWDLTRSIKVELEAAGCSIPFPQTDVHLHNAHEQGAA